MKSLAEAAVRFLSNNPACAVAVNPDMDSTRTQTDHISSLPDEILCDNILSRVSTKIAVRTSILSNRWRHLWKYIPSLRFCNYENETDCGFISRSIDLYRAQKLTEFNVMTTASELSIPPVQKWVDFAASKGVQVLKLHIFLENDEDDERVFEMAPSIYSAQSLEKLCLGGINFNPPLGFCGFRNLKNLALFHSRVSDEIVHTIVSTCELLEELRLSGCYGLVKCVIATQNMNLIHLMFYVEYDEDEKFELVIDVPNLQFFSYGGMLGPIRLNGFGGFASMRDIIEWDSWDQCDIMKELAKVKVLEVDDWLIMFLTTIRDDWGAGLSPVLPFSKLERLFWHGNVCTKTEVKLLDAFLGICPCLHEIQLNFSFCPRKFSKQEDENMPEVCVSSLPQLRYIGVFNYAGGSVRLSYFSFCWIRLLCWKQSVSLSESPDIERNLMRHWLMLLSNRSLFCTEPLFIVEFFLSVGWRPGA